MKRFVFVCILLIVLGLLFGGCGHNFGMVGAGTGFGINQHGMSYGDGIFGTFVTRDGVKFRAELDATTGLTYDPDTNTYKGIKSIEYSLPPQINGYAVEFAKDNPEVAEAYYKALIEYYAVQKDTPQTPLVSDEKSKNASASIADILKAALEKAKGKGESSAEPFDCDGDCELANLDAIGLREWQTAAAKKLLTYADDTTKFEGEELTLKASLEQFLTRMEQYKAKGIDTVGLRVRRATIKANKLTAIRYVYHEDGREIETNCPECIFIPELDVKGDEAE